eukprot:4755923-Pyramimonas_sp.AAC.1
MRRRRRMRRRASRKARGLLDASRNRFVSLDFVRERLRVLLGRLGGLFAVPGVSWGVLGPLRASW